MQISYIIPPKFLSKLIISFQNRPKYTTSVLFFYTNIVITHTFSYNLQLYILSVLDSRACQFLMCLIDPKRFIHISLENDDQNPKVHREKSNISSKFLGKMPGKKSGKNPKKTQKKNSKKSFIFMTRNGTGLPQTIPTGQGSPEAVQTRIRLPKMFCSTCWSGQRLRNCTAFSLFPIKSFSNLCHVLFLFTKKKEKKQIRNSSLVDGMFSKKTDSDSLQVYPTPPPQQFFFLQLLNPFLSFLFIENYVFV